MNNTVNLIVSFTAKANKINELKEALLELIPFTLKEPGCLTYELSQVVDAPEQFIFYEKWESEAHLDVHLQQSHVLEFRNKMGNLLFDLPNVKMTKTAYEAACTSS